MPAPMDGRSAIAALLVALGLVGAGWFAARGMAGLKTADRYVTVKGSAEKLVDADLVVWPLTHAVGGNDLKDVQDKLDANNATIRAFFARAGSRPGWRTAGRGRRAKTGQPNGSDIPPRSSCAPPTSPGRWRC